MSSVSIRAAVFDDIPAISIIEQFAPTAAHWTADHYKTRIRSQMACVLIAESDGKICGFLCSRIVAGEWEIENIVVAQEFRRRGVGAALMGALIAKWEESVGAAILLEVRESNTAARVLYEKHGLREVGRRRDYYHDPPEDAVLYARIRHA